MSQVTFAVSPEVELGGPLPPIDYREALTSSLRGPIEALWTPSAPLVLCEEDHALLASISCAFFKHYPLRLSPDSIWLTLARGFALHVNLHAEDLRHHFVQHSGKLKLTVNRPDFFPAQDNPWPEAFAAFSDQIAAHVGKLRDFLRADFSTTGPVERAVSDLIVMDSFQAYFEYELMAGCGIPSITLTGTDADWKSIRQRASLFAEFGLEEWSEALDPILAQFVAAAQGNADKEFWRSMFRYRSGSGGAAMTGWITTFFPYLKNHRNELHPSPYLANWQQRLEIDERQNWREGLFDPQGPPLGAAPPCLTSVPLKVFWGSEECAMRLIGGLMGVSQRADDLALEPQCGWAVVYDTPQLSSFSSNSSVPVILEPN